MNWLPTLLPWQWAVMAAVPIGIILLYFLKLKREPVEVPSTYLWQRTVEDLHVNSLLQRLRRSILLMLQLLAVLLAAIALLRPGIQGTVAGDGRYVFLLDTSASMSATDVARSGVGDANRFELARRLIGERIGEMTDSDVAMLVTFSDRAEVMQSFTSDRARLRDALDRAKLTNHSTDVMSALQAADGLANPRRTSEDANDYQVADALPADLLVYSDGNFQTPTMLTLAVGKRLTPAVVESWLIDVGYESADSVTIRGRYRRDENTIDVFAPIADYGSRVIWGESGEIASIEPLQATVRTPDPDASAGNELGPDVADQKPDPEPETGALKISAVDVVTSELDSFSLGHLTPEYIPIGADTVDNLAITTFYAERNSENPTEIQAFATIMNLGTQRRKANAVLTIDGVLQEASAVDLQRGEQVGLSFALEFDDSISLKLALEQPGNGSKALDDDLKVDDVAYAGLSPMKTVSVLVVTPGNRALELGLSTVKTNRICDATFESVAYLETEEYKKRASAGVDDLIIFDRCSPASMPRTNSFSIGALPNDQWTWDSEPGSIVPIDLNRTHPLLRYVELYSLLIFEGRSVKGPDGTLELASGDTGMFMALAPRDGHQDVVLGFPIVSTDADGNSQTNTNWFAERSWPVFLFNVVRHLAGAAEERGAPSYRPGSSVRIRIENAVGEVQLKQNDKPAGVLTPDRSGAIEMSETNRIGNYRLEADKKVVSLFAVNLFDENESRIAVSPAIEIGYETVDAITSGIDARIEYWRILLVVVLAILFLEWIYYTRRIA